MIAISVPDVIYCKECLMETVKSDHNKQLVALIVITLSDIPLYQ